MVKNNQDNMKEFHDTVYPGNLWQDFDFNTLNSDEFKEDSVREILILPLLYSLGYQNNSNSIIRNQGLSDSYIKTGSTKRKITLIPDYILRIDQANAWVLEAKNPKENITSGEYVQQTYYYAVHYEIRAKYFALCNGREFALFRTDNSDNLPILAFSLDQIEQYWTRLYTLLSVDSFQTGKKSSYVPITAPKYVNFDYMARPLLPEITVRKQAAKRYFGCNSYFTRQSWDIVRAYILNFSQPGDTVLDPFGGSGITAIEALMLERKAIHLDLNPLCIFMVDALVAPVDVAQFNLSVEAVTEQFNKERPESDEECQKIAQKYGYPSGITLPRGSDVETIEQLFSLKQRAHLALLKAKIQKVENINIRKSLFLAFYNTVSVCNLTFHKTPKGGGNHFGYYYRYRLAHTPFTKDIINVFQSKASKIVNGKKEMALTITNRSLSNLICRKNSAVKLDLLSKESVDYIYTDPPYGKKIAYLDLSIIWNAWLDLPVTEEDYLAEAIVGGEHEKTKQDYNQMIAASISEMYRVLKFDRWLSFVFAHKDPEFWHLIVETAEKSGFEYAGAVAQKNGQTSFKKRQNPFTVLSGQLIINFKKVRNPRAIMKANLGMDISEIVMETIEGIIAQEDGATLEQINDELILRGLELGFLDLLKKEYSDLTPILEQTFEYEPKSKKFFIVKDRKFTTRIDLKLRVKYYLVSFLRRLEIQNRPASFDEIVLNILPLLKNGITPDNQTILSVLEDIGVRTTDGQWSLKKSGQLDMFVS
ncbi:MAG: DNA methyltransferase [Candidatus Pacebacteria bacterium]|nr:DNA methyltransferase [Candidatus Paceibacterota bacterium]